MRRVLHRFEPDVHPRLQSGRCEFGGVGAQQNVFRSWSLTNIGDLGLAGTFGDSLQGAVEDEKVRRIDVGRNTRSIPLQDLPLSVVRDFEYAENPAVGIIAVSGRRNPYSTSARQSRRRAPPR